MSELVVGSIAGLAANSYVVDVASGSTLDLSNGAVFPAGNVIQVVRATDATNRATTSNTYVDADISVTITPSSASNKILLVWSVLGYTPSGEYLSLGITDSSNNVLQGAERIILGDGQIIRIYMNATLFAYDSPATTSAVTYKGRFRTNGTASGSLENDRNTGQLFAIEVAG